MSVIYLQDYDPWAALGNLTGQYATHRLGALQQNNMAKGYQAMLGGGNSNNPNNLQVMENQNRTGLWNNGNAPASQFNAGEYISNTMRNQLTQPHGLWGMQNAAQPTAQPAAQPVQANTTQPPVNQTGLWNFNNDNATQPVAPTYQDMLMRQGGQNFFQSAPRLVGNGDSGTEQQEPKKYTIPDKADITKQARQKLGADVLSLVKSGFDFKTARELANEQYQSNINDMYTKQVSEYQENVLEPMRQQIMNNLVFSQDENGNPVVDTYNSKRVKGLAPAVARYNYLAGRIGAGQIDMNNLNSIAALDKPDYKFSNAQNGHIIRYNMGEGTLQDMGGYGKVETKQFANGQVIVMTPDGQIKNLGNYGAKNVKVMPDGKTYVVGTDGSMQYVGTHVKPQTQTVTGNSGYQAQIVRTLSQQHINWMKQNPGESQESSPFYAQLQQAIGGTATPSIVRQPSYSSEEQAAVAQKMNELQAQGYSDDQIAAELDASGYGNYKSWLKSY